MERRPRLVEKEGKRGEKRGHSVTFDSASDISGDNILGDIPYNSNHNQRYAHTWSRSFRSSYLQRSYRRSCFHICYERGQKVRRFLSERKNQQQIIHRNLSISIQMHGQEQCPIGSMKTLVSMVCVCFFR